MTPRLRRHLALAVLLLIGAALLAWMVVRAQSRIARTDEVPPRAAPPVPVVLGTVVERIDDAMIDVIGSGLAERSVVLFPAVPGEVAEVRFRGGELVQAQQVLLRLVDRPQRLAVDLAAARLDAARRLRARYEATRGTGAVPGSVIDEAQSNVALAQIQLRQAREALADRVLRAPFSGVVGLTEIDPGDRVALDTPIATLDDRRNLRVEFELPEAYAARLQPGQALTVSNPAFGGRRFEGRVAQIDSRVDEVSRNLRVRATVPNADDVLRPGMSFQVRLTLPGERFVAVPELAMQWGREGAFVWVVRDGKAEPVRVRSVRRVQSEVLVDGPLRAGESVVVEGVQRLRPGRPVTAVATRAARDGPGRPALRGGGTAASAPSPADAGARR